MAPEVIQGIIAAGGGIGAVVGGFFTAKRGAHKGASEGAALLNGAAKRLERVETSVEGLSDKFDRYALSTERRLTRLETVNDISSPS